MLKTTRSSETLSALERKTQTQPLPLVYKKNPWTGRRVLIVDAILIWVAYLLAHYLRYTVELIREVNELNDAPFEPFIPYTLTAMVWVLLANHSAGLYEIRRGRTWANELFTIVNGATNAAVLVMAISFLLQPLVFSRLLIIQAAVLIVILLGLWRLVLRTIASRLRRRGIGIERVLVIGASNTGLNVLRTLLARPDLGYRVVGFLDDDPERGRTDLGRVSALGAVNKLPELLDSGQIDLVIVTLSWEHHQQINAIVDACERKRIAVRTVPDLFQLNLSQVQVENLGGIPVLGLQKETGMNRANRLLKRVMDLAIVVAALPVLLIVITIIGIAIKLDSPGSVFFSQERVGLNGRRFRVVKFRSMVRNAEALWEEIISLKGNGLQDPRLPKLKTEDDPRITRVGRFLRRTSLDELPNLFNVLKGDMSLVGPRPQVPQEVKLYAPWQYQRLRVPPGMTGLWQISGRSDVPFDEMCLLDIYYIENWSLALDLQILLQTVPKVLLRIGAY